jgi:hypothetical protein
MIALTPFLLFRHSWSQNEQTTGLSSSTTQNAAVQDTLQSLNIVHLDKKHKPVEDPDNRKGIKGQKIAGGCCFGISYGLALIAGIVLTGSDHSDDQRIGAAMCIPIAGPMLAFGVDQFKSTPTTVMYITWTLAETIGAALITAGIVRSHRLEKKSKTTVSVYPIIDQRNSPGIACMISF